MATARGIRSRATAPMCSRELDALISGLSCSGGVRACTREATTANAVADDDECVM